jgi:hypothetical protein
VTGGSSAANKRAAPHRRPVAALKNLKGHIWAARGEHGRSPFASLRENAALSGSCLPSAPLRENQALETDPPSGDRSAPR